MKGLARLLREVESCRLYETHLEHGVRPVLQVDAKARSLLAGQAPGRRVHASGVPFDDRSGDRLREWLGVDRTTFYDTNKIAILPMGSCYPGTGKSGDLPPRRECAEAWRDELLNHLSALKLTLVIGEYARQRHFDSPPGNLTETAHRWKDYRPSHIPLPHPSPRNNLWVKKNPLFEAELLPYLRRRVSQVLR